MLTWFALLALLAAAQAHRRCGNLACSHALSLVRFSQDFTSPDGTLFARGTTVTVFSKDGSEWETEASVLRILIIILSARQVNGARFFFQASLVDELSVFVPDPRFEVPRPTPPTPQTPHASDEQVLSTMCNSPSDMRRDRPSC